MRWIWQSIAASCHKIVEIDTIIEIDLYLIRHFFICLSIYLIACGHKLNCHLVILNEIYHIHQLSYVLICCPFLKIWSCLLSVDVGLVFYFNFQFELDYVFYPAQIEIWNCKLQALSLSCGLSKQINRNGLSWLAIDVISVEVDKIQTKKFDDKFANKGQMNLKRHTQSISRTSTLQKFRLRTVAD